MNKFQLITCLLLAAVPCSYAENENYAENDMHHPPTETTKVDRQQQIDKALLIENARAKATIPGVKVSAGYFKLTNNSEQQMVFTHVMSNAAQFTEFHTMEMNNNKMIMRKMETLTIASHQSITFKEGGKHLMFMGLKQRFTPGDQINLTLTRDNGMTYKIILPVMNMAAH